MVYYHVLINIPGLSGVIHQVLLSSKVLYKFNLWWKNLINIHDIKLDLIQDSITQLIYSETRSLHSNDLIYKGRQL